MYLQNVNYKHICVMNKDLGLVLIHVIEHEANPGRPHPSMTTLG